MAKTFQNPVFDRSFADPFVLKFKGEYFAYSTGIAADGRCFGRLRSKDLVNWDVLPAAMPPLKTGEPFYWAPEVTYDNGKFYLYYSVGNETLMTLRVAVSDRPDGEFIDAGVKLTHDDFAIDAHVFRDDDGILWMFYAKDFLDHSHIGTGTVADRMIDMFTLAGAPKPVTRARYDWQIYDPARREKGGVRWHTVEGPFVLKRKGVYYQMFSGGNWQNISYGVSYATAHDLHSTDEWDQAADGANTLPLLSTVPKKVIGPGHNSVIRGPNNRELYCVYHSWKDEKRVLAIDRMDFAGSEQMFISGPSFEPVTRPYAPTLFIHRGVAGETIETGRSFLCELTMRSRKGCPTGIELLDGDGTVGMIVLDGMRPKLSWRDGVGNERHQNLSGNWNVEAFHEFRIEVDRRTASFKFGQGEARINVQLQCGIDRIRLIGELAEFFGITVTRGFEDLFETDDATDRGWCLSGRVVRTGTQLDIKEGGRISRMVWSGDAETAVNLRLGSDAAVSIICGPRAIITGKIVTVGETSMTLPAGWAADRFHQFTFVQDADQMIVLCNGVQLGCVRSESNDELSIAAERGDVRLDMVRWTAI